jgi:predicted MFS family arabinose efflux permease
MKDTNFTSGPEADAAAGATLASAIKPHRLAVSVPALVAETLSVQATGTMAVMAVPAIAPEIAHALALPVSHVGYQVGIVYCAATFSSLLASSAVAAFGPYRAGRIAMIFTALGCLAIAVPCAWSAIAGSLIIGGAYGLINPAASKLLMQYSPPNRRNLLFSLKQTGVPLGGAAAGLIGPVIALSFGWTKFLFFIAALAGVLAAFSQLSRQAADGGSAKSGHGERSFSLQPLRTLIKNRKLLWLALSSFCFAAVQLCAVAFLVALLVEDLGFSLVAAGTVLAAVQICGALGRVLWGWAADRTGDGTGVLFCLAGLMWTASIAVMFVSAWPPYAAVVPFLMLGLSAAGWNGVYLSEVARNSPVHAVSAMTGAAMFFTFAGVVIAPPLFSLLHTVLGSYVLCYGPLAVLSAAGALLIRSARSPASGPASDAPPPARG